MTGHISQKQSGCWHARRRRGSFRSQKAHTAHCGATMKAPMHCDADMAKFIAMGRSRHLSCIFLPCALLTPKCAAHVAMRRDWGAMVDKEGQPHEIPWDSVGVLDCTVPSFTIVLSVVPRLDHSGDKITAREYQ